MTTWRIPRESVEWIGPVVLTGDVAPIELALIPQGARPTSADWKSPEILGGQSGYLVSGLAPGRYSLWAKVSDTPEIPVFDDVVLVVIT